MPRGHDNDGQPIRTMTNRNFLRGAVTWALPLLLVACQAPAPMPSDAGKKMAPGSALTPELADAAARAAAGPPTSQEKAQAFLYRGTGVVVKGLQPGGGAPPGPGAAQAAGGNVVLNFEGADLREVVRNILGDILNENYTIDPAVGGTVTIRTSSGIPRDALPATLGNAVARQRRDDDQERRPVHGGAAGGRGARQRHAAAREFVARIAAGVFRADRAAALCRRARDAADPRAVRQGCAGGAPGRAAQHADPVRHRARTAAPDGNHRHVRHRLDGGHVGRRVHAAELGRQVGDGGAREARRRPEYESDHGDPQDRADRADERAAGRHAAAGLSRGGQEVDRAPRQGRRRRRLAALRVQPAEHARGAPGAPAAAGVHRPRDAAGGTVGAHGRARHAGGNDRQSADVQPAAPSLPRRRRSSSISRPLPRRPAAPRASASSATCRSWRTRTTTSCW